MSNLLTSGRQARAGCVALCDDERTFWLAVRQALLVLIAAIERRLDIVPTTADLRKAAHN